MSRFTGATSPRPLRVLSLDGGGVRGFSSLVILRTLMHQIDPDAKEGNSPKPCDYFDLIVGTSTGGLIAIMLGRLEMSVEQCIKEYKNLAKKIFKPRKRTYMGGSRLWNCFGYSTFNAKYFEDAIKQILNTAKLGEDAELLDRNPKCKIIVCTTTYSNNEPALLRNYVSKREHNTRCTIVQAARATSAAPLAFDPIKINDIKYSDGGLRNNNPIKVVRTELRKAFPGRPGGCIVSIGTGVHRTQSIGKSLVAIASSCARLVTNVEDAHYDFKANECGVGGPFRGKYFRFNVDQGLQDTKLHEWKRLGEVESNTLSYLQKKDHKVGKCIECLLQCDEVEEIEEKKTILEPKSVARLKRALRKVTKRGKSNP